jgi:hypothetical protein
LTVTTPLVSSQVNVVVTATYNQVQQTANVTILPKVATTTGLATTGTPSQYGQSVTFTATPTSGSNPFGVPTGTVTFMDGTTVLGTASMFGNEAWLAVNNLSVGTHSITASYSGDSNYQGSTSAVLKQKVTAASTTTALASSLNPAVFGQNVTWTATVKSNTTATPTGSVQYKDGTTLIGTATLNASGVATLTSSKLSSGTHSITAQFVANTNFLASVSSPLSQVVTQASSSTVLAVSPDPAKKGAVVTLTATVSPQYSGSPTGKVTFLDGTTTLGAATVNPTKHTASFKTSKLAVGSHSLTASYGGSTDFKASVSAPITETINP